MTAELTQQEIDHQIDAAIAREPEQIFELRAIEVLYNQQSRKIIIHFDNDCTFECPVSMLQGIFGTKAWMKKIAAKGGRSKSEKKQAASRINGAKGGRPRKVS